MYMLCFTSVIFLLNVLFITNETAIPLGLFYGHLTLVFPHMGLFTLYAKN